MIVVWFRPVTTVRQIEPVGQVRENDLQKLPVEDDNLAKAD